MAEESPAAAARALVAILLLDPPCTESDGCVERESRRPLALAEQDRGWAQRPFNSYDPDNMCLACRAYWHVEMAAQALERRQALRSRFEIGEPVSSGVGVAVGHTGALARMDFK